MGPGILPLLTADRIVSELENNADLIFVEIHAEATSEKEAMGWYLDGRASVVMVPIHMSLLQMEEFLDMELLISLI